MARTTNPFSILSLKTVNVEAAKISVTSMISIGLRKSGLSLPYLSIDSVYGILTKGGLETFLLLNLLKISNINGSTVLNTSSCVTNDISISS